MRQIKVNLKWRKNKSGRWQTYYKGRIIECDSQGKFLVNGLGTNNGNIQTIVNFIDDGCYYTPESASFHKGM